MENCTNLVDCSHALLLIHARNGHVNLRLRHGNRLALRLDRKAVLLEIAGG
jgi:hypothetical protein